MYLVQYRDSLGRQVGGHPLSGQKFPTKEDAAEAFSTLVNALPLPGVADVVIRPNGNKPIRCHVAGADPSDREHYWKGRSIFRLPAGEKKPEQPRRPRGRPKSTGPTGKGYNVYLQESVVERLLSLGSGSLSRGIAKAVEFL